MRRHLLFVLASISFVLAIVMSGFWVRSYRSVDVVHLGQIELMSSWGRCYIQGGVRRSHELPFFTSVDNQSERNTIEWFTLQLKPKLGFACGRWPKGPYVVLTPPWFWIGTFLLLPAFAIRSVLAQRRKVQMIKSGFCGRCGYDLRASQGRCPECGAPAPRKLAA